MRDGWHHGRAPGAPARADDEPNVDALPDAAAHALAALASGDLPALADRVFAADPLTEDEPTAEERAYFVARALVPLQALATLAVRRGGRVCHYYALHH